MSRPIGMPPSPSHKSRIAPPARNGDIAFLWLCPGYVLRDQALYLSAAAAGPWIPAFTGMTVPEEFHPYLVIPAQAGIQKRSGHDNIVAAGKKRQATRSRGPRQEAEWRCWAGG